jgi:nicotinamide riboside transporter PnuC
MDNLREKLSNKLELFLDNLGLWIIPGFVLFFAMLLSPLLLFFWLLQIQRSKETQKLSLSKKILIILLLICSYISAITLFIMAVDSIGKSSSAGPGYAFAFSILAFIGSIISTKNYNDLNKN